jgi:5'-3' exonuclease
MYVYYATALRSVVDKTDVVLEEPDQGEVFNNWFASIVNFLKTFLSSNIGPIFCLDGIQPVYKDGTKEDRYKKYLARKKEIDDLKTQINESENMFNVSVAVQERLKAMYRQNVYIPKDNVKIFYNVLRGIGIPVLQATGEGERLASALYRDGKVAAVYSADRDCLVHGCDLLITGLSKEWNKKEARTFDAVYLPTLLHDLDIAFDSFVDLCILAGCDYNKKIRKRGAKRGIGIKIIYRDIISKYSHIEKLPERQFDINQCRHKICRELFAPYPYTFLIRSTLTFDDNEDEVNEVSKANEVNGVSEANEVNEVSKANEVNGVSEANEVNGVSEANEVNEVSKANEVNGVSEANEVNGVSEANEVNEVSEADEIKKNTMEFEVDDTVVDYGDTIPDSVEINFPTSEKELAYDAIEVENLMFYGGKECLELVGQQTYIGMFINLLTAFRPCSDSYVDLE